MFYPNTKIYSDGSHFIAIPHSTNPTARRSRVKEEMISVIDEYTTSATGIVDTVTEDIPTPKKPRQATRSDLFDECYKSSLDLPKPKRQPFILSTMRKYFSSPELTKTFVDKKIDDKIRSNIARRVRFIRKALNNEFNYFMTFTYDDALHTEQSFRAKLSSCISTLQKRRNWRYMGVWERGNKTNRLHFHGLFWVPKGSMVGELFEKKDYNFKARKMQSIQQNTYFNARFGRTDIEELNGDPTALSDAIAYILKYLEKSGEKIVYSHGLNMYVVSDIDENDVICRIGMEDKKLLLFDDFACYNDGEYLGAMSTLTKSELRTSN